VGAGLSGLVAAHRLVAAGVSDVLVLEARERVGGRTLNRDLGDGAVAELGG
jgi:monoamine oxidase